MKGFTQEQIRACSLEDKYMACWLEYYSSILKLGVKQASPKSQVDLILEQKARLEGEKQLELTMRDLGIYYFQLNLEKWEDARKVAKIIISDRGKL